MTNFCDVIDGLYEGFKGALVGMDGVEVRDGGATEDLSSKCLVVGATFDPLESEPIETDVPRIDISNRGQRQTIRVHNLINVMSGDTGKGTTKYHRDAAMAIYTPCAEWLAVNTKANVEGVSRIDIVSFVYRGIRTRRSAGAQIEFVASATIL